MLTYRSVVFNTSVQLVGRFLSGILSFFSLLLLAQSLGVFYYGEYSKITIYLAFFYMVIDFGINAIYLREVGDKVKEKFPKLLGLRLFMGFLLVVLASVLMLGLKTISPQGFTDLVFWAFLITGGSIVLNGITVSAAAIFQHQRRYDKLVFGQVAASLTTVILLSAFYGQIKQSSQTGVIIAAGILIVSSVINSLVSLFFLKKNWTSLLPEIDFRFFRKILLLSIPFGLTLVFNTVYFRIDTMILTVYKSSFEVGAYSLAYKFFEFALVLPAFVMNSFYPDLLEKRKTPGLFWKNTKALFTWLLLLSFVVSFMFLSLAPFLKFIKTDFNNSIVLLRILALSLPIFYLSSPLMWYYVILKQQKKLVIIYAISMFFNILMNLWLIPLFGATGAAVTTGATELLVLLLGIIIFKNIKHAI